MFDRPRQSIEMFKLLISPPHLTVSLAINSPIASGEAASGTSAPSLSAVSIPASGGDTYFSNQEAAFAELSLPLQEFLSGLTAVHDGESQFRGVLDMVGEGTWEGKKFSKLEPSEHPVVRTHPETGKLSLKLARRLTQVSRRQSGLSAMIRPWLDRMVS